MRQLVQVRNETSGEMEWCEVATGQVLQKSRPAQPAFVAAQIGEFLFQQEPAIHGKLMRGEALNWREIAAASDVVLCGVSQESLRSMFGARSMRDIKRAIDTMLSCQHLCKALSPRLSGSALPSPSGATSAMRSLLTLPGQR